MILILATIANILELQLPFLFRKIFFGSDEILKKELTILTKWAWIYQNFYVLPYISEF